MTSLRWKLAVIFMIITLTAVTATTLYSRYAHLRLASSQASMQELNDLKLLSGEIETILLGVIRTLLALRDFPQLMHYLDAPDEFTRDHARDDIQHFFLSLAKHQSIFNQIRFLDDTGMELVRVNSDGRNSYLVPEEELQYKGHRYYFKESLRLGSDEIYLSPMDLNMERREIERPFVPVMRYSVPIIDREGVRRGAIVINVLGSRILTVVASQQRENSSVSEYYLINEQNYFLFHPDSHKQFGFMFGNDERFDLYEPEFTKWLDQQHVNHHQNNSVKKISKTTGKNVIFSYHRIPLWTNLEKNKPPSSQNTAQKISAAMATDTGLHPTGWFLVSMVEEAALMAGMTRYTPAFILFTFGLFVLYILVAVFVSSRVARPVISLAAAAHKIEGGDLSARAEIYTKDEMGDFGNLFNAMAQQLEISHKSLQQLEAKYRHIFENSKDCIFVADTSCQALDLNVAGRELFGCTAKDQLPIKMPVLYCAADDLSFDLRKIFAVAGYVRDYETVVQRPDHSERFCLMTASVRYDKHDNLYRL